MSTPRPTQIPPDIQQMLARLRRRIRAYVWIEGVAALVAVLGAAFWLGLALDWLIEPPPAIRAVVLGVVGLVLLVVLYRMLLVRAFARMADTSMAVLLEKYFADFHDSLLTSVELAEVPAHAEPFNPEMLSHTQREALAGLPRVRIGQVFNHRPLMRNVFAALVLAGSVVAFGLLAADAFGFYLERIQLSEEAWPRRTRLLVEGFPEPRAGLVKVARGSDYELLIRADNTPPFEVPARVEVRTYADGARRDARRIGQAVPGRDPFQEYSYTFKSLFESQTFDVIGADDRIRGLKLEVVDSPEIIEMSLLCDYPGYMGRGQRALAVTGAMEIPRGTRITLRARTNKDLVSVKILDPETNEPVELDLAGEAASDAPSRKQFEYPLPRLDKDQLLLFELHDHDGIKTTEPYRLSITAIPDEPPQVAVNLKGIGSAITPQARVPVVGSVSDDHGIDRIWFEHRIDEAQPAETPFKPQAKGENEYKVSQVLDAEQLELKPQQKLLLGVKAADRYDLDEGPNEGASQRFLLEVVTPDELRVILESRELLLRKRFEQVYEEMLETRDRMALIDFSTPAPAKKEAPPQPPAGDEREAPQPDENPEPAADEAAKGFPSSAHVLRQLAFQQPDDAPDAPDDADPPSDQPEQPSAEPTGEETEPADPQTEAETGPAGDADAATEADDEAQLAQDAEAALARRRLHVVRALHYVERAGHDALDVARAFDDIHEELVNNRLDTDEVRQRLHEGISQPLKQIGGPMIAELVRRLEELDKKISDPESGPAQLRASITQADLVLVEMKQVLDRMLELESYNEVLEILRAIVQEQQKLNEQTKEQRKKNLRNLLDDE